MWVVKIKLSTTFFSQFQKSIDFFFQDFSGFLFFILFYFCTCQIF